MVGWCPVSADGLDTISVGVFSKAFLEDCPFAVGCSASELFTVPSDGLRLLGFYQSHWPDIAAWRLVELDVRSFAFTAHLLSARTPAGVPVCVPFW